MNKHKYVAILLFGLALWLLETWYFGWNWEAQSAQEKIFDVVSQILIFWGMLGDILSNVIVIKNYNNK